jgi:hypothetical protein
LVTLDLSAEQASALQAFFITSAAYRKDEIDSWEELAAKRNAEGNPMLSKAKSNAEFFRKQDATIREISELLAKAQAEAAPFRRRIWVRVVRMDHVHIDPRGHRLQPPPPDPARQR